MNGNLAYWQFDFTVESQANLAPNCNVMQEKSKSFRVHRRPPNPRPTLLLGLRPSAHGFRPTAIDYFQIFSTRPGLIPDYMKIVLDILERSNSQMLDLFF